MCASVSLGVMWCMYECTVLRISYKVDVSCEFSITIQQNVIVIIMKTNIKKKQNELDQLISSSTSATKQQNNNKKIHSNAGKMSDSSIEGIDKEIAYVNSDHKVFF